jgi:hypothetical protein
VLKMYGCITCKLGNMTMITSDTYLGIYSFAIHPDMLIESLISCALRSDAN